MNGDPQGFWAKYGKMQKYSPADGAAPFDNLLEEICRVKVPAAAALNG